MDEIRMENFAKRKKLELEINSLKAKHNSLAADNSADGKRKVLLHLIAEKQRALNNIPDTENATIQKLKDEYNLVAEARQIIVKTQLEGAKEFDKIKKNITTNDIADKVQAKTDDIQTKINNLKNQNNVNSENAFMQNSKP